MGYIVDPYVRFFYKKNDKRRLPPIINRGYFARVYLIKKLMRAFCNLYAPIHQSNQRPKIQIVAFGAGYDTSFWNLYDELKNSHDIYFVEMDFHDVVVQKSKIILSQPNLHQNLHNVIYKEDGSVHSDEYCLFPVDLRDMNSLKLHLNETKIDKNIPTLFTSECVLIYLLAQHSSPILHLTSTFQYPFFILYEQILPHDNYGRMMVDNLNERGCGLKSIYNYPTLESQQKRFLDHGYTHVSARDMYDLYNNLIERDIKIRIERIEFFDEYEEWILILRHYCIVVAVKEFDQQIGKWAEFMKEWRFNQ
jgi:hypothetical protein